MKYPIGTKLRIVRPMSWGCIDTELTIKAYFPNLVTVYGNNEKNIYNMSFHWLKNCAPITNIGNILYG